MTTTARSTPIKFTVKISSAASEDESGTSFIEYALLLSLIAIIAMAATRSFGLGVSKSFSKTAEELNN